MPITDYHFENRIFFAKEYGRISENDALAWSDALREATESSDLPIVALVDAMEVVSIHRLAEIIFEESSFFDNLLAVVVATNKMVALQSQTIGLLGKRGHTRIFGSMEKTIEYAQVIVSKSHAVK